jgi:hypothetical protein
MSKSPQMSSLGTFFLRSPVLAAFGSGVVVVVVVWLGGIPGMIALPVGALTALAQWLIWRGGETSLGYRIKVRQAGHRSQAGEATSATPRPPAEP